MGLLDVEHTTLSRQSAHRWISGCQPYTQVVLYLQIDLTLVYVRVCVNPRAMVRLEGLGKLKKINYFIGSGTSDLPACSTAPEPSTLSHSINK
jgi:hypothetical protein